MQRIRILPEHLANQIAAGEVVQRPESVVKELVENAIDAGATSITVVVHEGGLRSIQVVDNGSGMSREDLELSVVRHATSKIARQEDLHAIQTLGFRGEALASIAAVAEVEIATSLDGDAHGWRLNMRPGDSPTAKPSASRVGTSMTVMNLFANVPARRKFLKSALTEFRYISETLQKLAIARPDVRFVLYDGQALVMDVQPEQANKRVCHVMRSIHEEDLLTLEHSEQGLWIKGFLGTASASRKNRGGQFLFLNGRSIHSKSLSFAVAQAYELVIPQGHHPVFAIWLDIDPERIDVNIHPQKHEVKFDNERAVFMILQQAVTHVLAKANLVPDLSTFQPLAQAPLQSLPGGMDGHVAFNRLTGEILDSRPHAALGTTTSSPLPGAQRAAATPSIGFHQAYEQLVRDEHGAREAAVLYVDRGLAYCRHEDGLMIIRLYAAAERVLYDKMLQRTEAAAGSSEQLIFPVAVHVDAVSKLVLEEHKQLVSTLGFNVQIEADVCTVNGIPWYVSAGNEEESFRFLLEQLQTVEGLDLDKQMYKMFIKLARRQAGNAVQDVSPSHVQRLVSDLRRCTMSHVSPSGKPTYTVITNDELERRLQ